MKKGMLAIFSLNRFKKILPLENIKLLENEVVLTVHPKDVYGVLKFLKDYTYCQYSCLTAISGTDYPERENRFEVAYELLSFHYNHRLRLKTFVNEVTPLPSVTSLYPAANWWEREVWDLLGVFFENHPDLRRILTDYGFQGHPLRKNFPLSGYVEVVYDERVKRVTSRVMEHSQEFRPFDYRSPWSRLSDF